MKKITLTKDQKTIHVPEAAAKLLKKAGWMDVPATPEILKQKKTLEPPEEVKELIRSKKEDVTVKEDPKITEPDVIAEPEIVKQKKASKPIEEKPKRTRKQK